LSGVESARAWTGAKMAQLGGMDTTNPVGKIRKSVKINIPVDKYPQFNFVGRLLGPRGSTLKQLQRDTSTWIRIRGRGSMRDKQEEARVRNKPGNEHLLEPLHVHIEAQQAPGAIDAVLSNAEAKVKALLIPVEESKDTHKKEQLRQLAQVRMAESIGTTSASWDPYAAQMQNYYYHSYAPQPYYPQHYYPTAESLVNSSSNTAALDPYAAMKASQMAGHSSQISGTGPQMTGDPQPSRSELEALQSERKLLASLSGGRLPLTTRLLDSEISRLSSSSHGAQTSPQQPPKMSQQQVPFQQPVHSLPNGSSAPPAPGTVSADNGGSGGPVRNVGSSNQRFHPYAQR